MGVILNFNSWKRLNESAGDPVKLNNEISALRAGDEAGMWAIAKRYGGLENMLDILADSGADRYQLAKKIRSKFGDHHFGVGGDGKMPKVSELLDSFEEETTWEMWKRTLTKDFSGAEDTYKGGETKDPKFFDKNSWQVRDGGIGGGDTRDPKFKL